MDSVTHIVLGAAIGETLLGKKLGKKGMLLGALVNNLPDVDVAANFFMTPVNAMIFHRGITHSFFFGIIISYALAFLFYKKDNRFSLSFNEWLKFFLVAILAHDVVDYFTSYGTCLLAPFTWQRFSANSIFVADPFYTFPLLVSFLILLIINSKSSSRRIINKYGIIISSFYLLYTFINKWNVDKIMRQNLRKQNIAYSNYFTTPAPLNNFLWYVAAKDEFGYHTGYYSVFDETDIIKFNYEKRNELITVLFPGNTDIPKLKEFSDDFYCFTKNEGSAYFNDLRFGRAAGWMNPPSGFVFRYRLSDKPEEALLRRGDVEISFKEAFISLVERIKGK
ncbi:MAG: metal-dependent hydrolase [Bacteroidia bacterium]